MPRNDFEVTYEIRVKENDMNFMNNISNMEGIIKSAIMLSYDGNLLLDQREDL
jgi:6-pyruvoyl-tetrahydropterin synthase